MSKTLRNVRTNLWALPLLLCAKGAVGKARIAFCSTPTTLAAAITDGTPHVVLTAHMDLTSLPLQRTASGHHVIFEVPAAVKSITGNCTTPPPARLLPGAAATHEPSQCVLSVANTAMRFSTRSSTVWLHSMHIRGATRDPDAPVYALLKFTGAFSDVWLTEATFSGSGGLVQGISAESTRTYIGQSAFTGLRSDIDPALSLEDKATYATTAFENVLFENNTATGRQNKACKDSPEGIVGVQATNACQIQTGATLRNCTFRANVGAPVATHGGDIFADVTLPVSSGADNGCAPDPESQAAVEGNYEEGSYEDSAPAPDTSAFECSKAGWDAGLRKWPEGSACVALLNGRFRGGKFACRGEFPRNQTWPLAALPTAHTPWRIDDYLSLDSPGLSAIRAARDEALAAHKSKSTSPSSGNASIAGISCAAVAGFALLAAICGVAWISRRRRRGGSERAPLTGRLGAGRGHSSAKLRAYTVPLNSGSGGPLWTSNEAYTWQTLEEPFLADTGVDRVHDTSLPAEAADVADGAGDGAEALESTLDAMHDARERFAAMFWVHDHFARRRGGQGVVQFMQRCQDEEEVAVKFFLSRGAFESEIALYQDPKLRDALVPLVSAADGADGPVCSRGGFAFPPFLVVERGESLNEWVSRVAPDLPTALFVLLHLAERLEKLHAAGLCHRDLKPANVLWRPQANAWALMDFGCAATIGELAPLAYSVHYAPPEVIAATEAGERGMVATGALDMWSLGVIAYELLTRRRLFAPPTTEVEARAQLAGREALPWERPEARAELAPLLKVLRRSVLQCLHRHPAERPTSRELLGAWNGLFESVTGSTTAAYVVPQARS